MTTQELIEKLNATECKTYQVGPSWSNHERAIWTVGTVSVLMDTVLPYNWFLPSKCWYWTGHNMPLEQAKKDAVKYGANVEEAYYCDEDNLEYMLFFSTLEGCCGWICDNVPQELASLWK